MEHLEISGEHRFVESPEHFALILEEKLGVDAAEYFRDCCKNFDGSNCPGECDHTYRLQEHYQRVIRDVLDDLKDVKVLKSHSRLLSKVVSALAAEL